MAKKTKRVLLKGNYHPESIKYIRENSKGQELTQELAQKLDQDWAAQKLGSKIDAASLMRPGPGVEPGTSPMSRQFKEVVNKQPILRAYDKAPTVFDEGAGRFF
jgi:hypothetical protein